MRSTSGSSRSWPSAPSPRPTPADRVVLGTRADELWTGEPYAECEAPSLRAEAARLVELHVTVQESRAEALLALGHPAAAVRLLAPVAPVHPYREQLWALLARAQYACCAPGRRAGHAGDAALAAGRGPRGRPLAGGPRDGAGDPGPGPGTDADPRSRQDSALAARGSAAAATGSARRRGPRRARRRAARGRSPRPSRPGARPARSSRRSRPEQRADQQSREVAAQRHLQHAGRERSPATGSRRSGTTRRRRVRPSG